MLSSSSILLIRNAARPRWVVWAFFALASGCGRTGMANHSGGGSGSEARVEPIFASNDAAPIFGMIVGLDLGSDSSIVVTEVRDARVSAFTSKGDRLYSIASRGSGPGDLQMPCCATLQGTDSLWVYNSNNRRFDIFSVGNDQPRYLKSIPSGNSSYFPTDRLELTPSGGVYHVSIVQLGPGFGSIVAEALDSVGRVTHADIILSAKDRESGQIEVAKSITGGTARYGRPVPFGARPLFALGPRGMYAISTNRSDSVLIRHLGGDTVAVISRPIEPVTISQAEADSASAAVDNWAKMVGVSSDLDYKPRTTKAPLVGLGYDADGRLWVQHAVAEGAPATADLFSADGSFLESRSWPSNIRLVSWASRGHTAIGVQIDSNGEQTVVRLTFNQ